MKRTTAKLGSKPVEVHEPEHVLEIFLQPGELYFGDADTRIRTLLGSCVAITLWHPRWRIGGMCHYKLPGRRLEMREEHADGRYADNALLIFLKEIRNAGTRPAEYTVKMIGGGNQFPGNGSSKSMSVPDRNIDAGRHLLRHHGFAMPAEHLGGNGHRNVIFDLWSGDVWVRHVGGVKEVEP
jgi:chemotaxis protein CheD